MKKSIWILLSFCLLLVFSCQKHTEIDKEKEEILVRKIGHEISRYVGDSIHSLNPITEIEPSLYQIEFKDPFSFFSDSVINIIHREMRKHDKQDDYIVKVEECDSENVVFSYFISPSSADSIVPCRGRMQDKNCYTVNIGLLPPQRANYQLILLIIGGFVVLGVIFFALWKNKKIDPEIKEDTAVSDELDINHIDLGQFGFNFEEQCLILGAERIKLTYKEAKLMKILSEHKGKVVTRESIQQEVWDDDGTLVSRSLDMFISKLRKKLKIDPGVEIKSIHGIGYKLIVS